MSEQVQRRRAGQEEASWQDSEQERPQRASFDLDAILDEIDTVLERDAEDFVRGFVQKGGQ